LDKKETNMTELEVEKHFPKELWDKFEFHQWKHACAILKSDFQNEWKDIIALLKALKLKKTWINEPGGRKTKLASWFDEFLFARGWCEKKFETSVIVDENRMDSPTHKVDCYKNRIALELEWNNKDPFFDRDLNNFRLLFDLRAISVGIIVTRCDELQELFDSLDRGKSYGTSTTHMSKLLPRIEGGGGSGCPILVIGMKKNLYAEDE
jgi:Restriction endonuclease BglII